MRLEAALPGLGLRRWRPACLGLALALAACGNTARQPFQGGPVAAGGSGGFVTGVGTAGGTATDAPTQAVASDMRRLSRAEYRATVTDVLGTPAPTSLPPEDNYYGFDNNSAALSVRESELAQFYQAAQELAHTVFADATLRAHLGVCKDATIACIASLVDNAGLRLFRRPLHDDERAIYTKLYTTLTAQGSTPDAAMEQMLVALLSSAQFLYRMEFSSQPGGEPLDPYELATRLSYLLWSSAPDDELLGVAKSGQLSYDTQLEQQLTRLWADARSQRFVESFAGQWLGARRVAVHAADPSVYPSWTPQVADAAAREVYEVFDHLLRSDADFLDLYRGTLHEIDPLLGPFYAETAGPDGHFHVAGERSSYLGSVAFLTITSPDRRSSPTWRGHFVLDELLCEHLPPPPANVPQLDFDQQPSSFRAQIEQYQEFAACRPCHAVMDPIGLALEHYDGIGHYRDAYSSGEPIDSTERLAPSPGYPSGLGVEGLPGVMTRVITDPAATRCATEKLYTYAMGAFPTDVDQQNIDTLTADWQSGPLTIKELARQIVFSKTFRYKLAQVAP